MPIQLDNLLLETGDVLLLENGSGFAIENTFQGYDILDVFPNWESQPREAIERSATVLDNVTGLPTIKVRGEQPRQSLEFHYRLIGIEQIAAFRTFVAGRRGAQRAFWIPTWLADVKPTENIFATDFDIEDIDYTENLFPNTARRHMVVIRWDHAMTPFEVLGSQDNADGTERLFTSVAFGASPGWPPQHVMVSFLLLVRLAAPVEYTYLSPDHMSARIQVLEVPVEVP